ncbi:pilus assembly protein TadB [Vibrio azureus]|uniref:Type II secretion system protein GspF domain-containing protein n=1 Tax=Vibrio azureus NBRC 104587 TaxID=1219077 RepID=U3AM80_9VIBR|nr:type II secretion system F family protein [Vibrio azureus]AUI86822.1 pilus assembly protein TadB [Vibrio azureus]GAD74402.1 hypothetical protein VAZ01S_010_00550 [Vibrio azureus NBRC 104587]
MDGELLLFLVLLFFSIFFVSQALIFPSAREKIKRQKILARIENQETKNTEENISILKGNTLENEPFFVRWLSHFRFLERLSNMLTLAGLSLSLSQFLGWVLLLFSGVTLALFLFGQTWYISFGGGGVSCIVVFAYLKKRISDRLMQFEEQLPEALDIIKRVLQAGQPINHAFGEVGREMNAPLGPEFLNTFNLLNYGYDLRLAVLQMSERVPTVSLLAFSSAVLLQKETGGNLVENIEKLSQILRARFKLARKIKTISAESRMSAWVLMLAPFAMYVVISLIRPEYIALLHTSPMGVKMIIGGIVSLFIGSLWIRRIINIEV